MYEKMEEFTGNPSTKESSAIQVHDLKFPQSQWAWSEINGG